MLLNEKGIFKRIEASEARQCVAKPRKDSLLISFNNVFMLLRLINKDAGSFGGLIGSFALLGGLATKR